MTTLKPLLAKNRSWALQCRQRSSQSFQQNVHSQPPHWLWIGCPDPRVPAHVQAAVALASLAVAGEISPPARRITQLPEALVSGLNLFGGVYDLQTGYLKELIQQNAEVTSP